MGTYGPLRSGTPGALLVGGGLYFFEHVLPWGSIGGGALIVGALLEDERAHGQQQPQASIHGRLENWTRGGEAWHGVGWTGHGVGWTGHGVGWQRGLRSDGALHTD